MRACNPIDAHVDGNPKLRFFGARFERSWEKLREETINLFLGYAANVRTRAASLSSPRCFKLTYLWLLDLQPCWWFVRELVVMMMMVSFSGQNLWRRHVIRNLNADRNLEVLWWSRQGADNGIDSIMRASLSHSRLALEGGFWWGPRCQVWLPPVTWVSVVKDSTCTTRQGLQKWLKPGRSYIYNRGAYSRSRPRRWSTGYWNFNQLGT